MNNPSTSRPLRWYDLFTINIYFMGLTTLSQTMTPLVVPLLVQQFVGEGRQGSFYGTLRLWSLMAALLAQALMGMLSDRCTSRWGRRRPFIFIGTLADILVVTAIGLTAGMEGMSGYWMLFFLLIMMSLSSNTAHGAVQGLIPDLVPENQRGRHSGVKAILEIPVPMILVSFTIGKMIAAGNMWLALIVMMAIVLLTMVITMFAPEKQLEGPLPPLDIAPFARLLLMTTAFTVIILGAGQVVRSSSVWFTDLPMNTAMLLMGGLGLAAMLLAVVVGVWSSVQLSIGDAAKKNPSFTWWVISRLAFLVGATNLASFAVFFLQGRLGLVRELAAGPASRLIMFVGIFILVLGFPGGWMVDRFGRKPLLIISGLVAALGVLVLVLASGLTAIYIGAVLVGAGAGIFYPANWALGADLVPKQEAGRYLGISNLAGAGAGAVGAYIGGPIADYFTNLYPGAPGIGYVVLFSIYGVLFLLSTLAVLRVHPPAKTGQGTVPS